MQRGVRVAAIAALGVALALTGCGGEERVGEADGGEMTVSREGEGVRIASEKEGIEGHFGPGAELPKDFPDDVPLPPDAEIIGSMVSEREGTMVSLRTGAPVAEVLDAMRRGLEEEGWTLDEEANLMGQHVLPATKGSRQLIVQVMEREGAAHVMVHVGEEG